MTLNVLTEDHASLKNTEVDFTHESPYRIISSCVNVSMNCISEQCDKESVLIYARAVNPCKCSLPRLKQNHAKFYIIENSTSQCLHSVFTKSFYWQWRLALCSYIFLLILQCQTQNSPIFQFSQTYGHEYIGAWICQPYLLLLVSCQVHPTFRRTMVQILGTL